MAILDKHELAKLKVRLYKEMLKIPNEYLRKDDIDLLYQLSKDCDIQAVYER